MTAMHVLKLRLCSSVWTFFQTNALPSARVAGESASWERREREQKNALTGLVSGDGFPNTPLISAVPNSITEHEHESSRHFIGTLELTSSNNFWQLLQKPPPTPLQQLQKNHHSMYAQFMMQSISSMENIPNSDPQRKKIGRNSALEKQ